MPRRSTPSRPELRLQRENDKLITTICCLRREVEDKGGVVGRLEILLRERLTAIDALNGKIQQLRDQNRRLDIENACLIEMLQVPPAAVAS